MQNHLGNKAYAGFFVRLAAFAVDSLLAAVIVGIVKFPFSIAAAGGVGFLEANFIFKYSFLDVFSYAGVAAYFILLTYFSHSTPGKLLFRLEVITKNGDWTFLNILYRETVGRFLSSLLYVGYLAVLVQGEKQGFHDMLCDTYVVYKNMTTAPASRLMAAARAGNAGGVVIPSNGTASSEGVSAVSAFKMEESHPVPVKTTSGSSFSVEEISGHTFSAEESVQPAFSTEGESAQNTDSSGDELREQIAQAEGEEQNCLEETQRMVHSYDNINPDSTALNINKE